jgi:hypothetical protein
MESVRARLCGLAAAVWMASVASGVPHAVGASPPAAAGRAEVVSPAAAPAVVKPIASSRQSDASTPAGPELRRVLDQYCVGCHNGRAVTSATASGVVLDRADLAAVPKDGEMWEKGRR